MKISKKNVKNLFIGIGLDAMGVAIITKSDLGISAVSSVAYALSNVLPVFTFGIWSYLYQFALFVIMCVLVKKCDWEYLSSFLIGIVFGYALDLCRFLIHPLPETLLLRIIYFVGGTGLLILGVAFLIISELPIMPQDLFPRELAKYFNIPYRYVKTTFDVVSVIVSFALGIIVKHQIIGLGIGTVISALIVGKSVDRVKKKLLKI